ncbi:MAG TPA: MMPL family transporter [Acetobacteraceae bacterium]|nr:MMPL family transporter [Acetobacteraceae bacterium]
MSLPSLLAALVGRMQRRAPLVVLVGALLMIVSAWYGATHLAVTTNTDALFSPDLPWRQRQIAWDKSFPQFNDLLVAVVDAKLPEEADATAAALADALAADRAHFSEVRRPDASPYLQRNGLMFLSEKELGDLLNRIIDAQPFLGQLVADPSARGLFSALTLLATGVERGQADLASFSGPLHGFESALSAAAAGHPQPLSWEDLLTGQLAAQAGQYRFVLAKVKLDFSALEPGRDATDAMRAAIARLPFVRDGSAHVRITGNVAMADEEFGTVFRGMAVGTVGTLLLISVWLVLAVKTWRLILPMLMTLWLGLALTVGFAALAVGTLNLISLAFTILFIGIAVDFAIQVSVRFRAALFETRNVASALELVARIVGPEVMVAAAAAACGFAAFVPTNFAGVAELGEIAGIGMVIAFLCTLLFLPAAITIFRPRPDAAPVGIAWGDRIETKFYRMRRPLLAFFALLALAGAALLPTLRFDADPLHTKNPNTEAMRTLRDLMNSPITDPYTVDILTPSLRDAEALAARLHGLKLVDRVLTLGSFVPEDQPPKLALIADAANILQATLTPSTPEAPVTPDDLRLAARTAAAGIAKAVPKLPADSPLRPIGDDLQKLAAAPDDVLMATNKALVQFLPMQMDRLRLALDAHPVTAADLPPDITRDWLLPDGRARVQVVGTPQTHGSAGLQALVGAVRQVAPDAQGTAVTIVESARTIIDAFRTAAVLALVAIAVILAIALQRARDVALVMAPLLLSSLLTVVAVQVMGLKLNFANIIALPLLLGVGVSFNVYFVMNWRKGSDRFLGTATARAIVLSALTTGTAFGSLALSGHPGTASMGVLLLLSLGSTVIATLVFEPTLLLSLRTRR